jgi:phage terminase small subunit
MSRPRTPTAILDTKGAFLANPQRKREGEPQPAGSIGSAPKHFSQDEKKIWREFVRTLAPGVGKSSDRLAAELIVRLILKERARTITSTERGHLILLVGRFGLTPADRAKISVEAPRESALQRFLNRRNTGTSTSPAPIQ